MKINNKLFLITATLGIMAAGSVTAFANHSNYVYVQNQTTQSATATESWQSGGHHMHFYNGSNGTSCSPLTITIPAGQVATFRQDENSHWRCNSSDTTCSGIGLFTFEQNGQTISETATIHYHTFWEYNGSDGDYHASCSWNRLNYGELLGTANLNATYLALWNTNGSNTMKPGNELNCTGDTKMSIMIRNPKSPFNSSTTSSPIGKLSNILSSFKL